MFTIDQVKEAHSKVKSGADFPKYIKALRHSPIFLTPIHHFLTKNPIFDAANNISSFFTNPADLKSDQEHQKTGVLFGVLFYCSQMQLNAPKCSFVSTPGF
jgi:hypothetical protein